MAVGPSACIGCQLVPAPHSSVAVRNRQRLGSARLPRAPWNKWKGPASAQCSEAGVGSGPFMPRKALATGRAALRFAPEAADERRGTDDSATGRFGPCAIARGPSHAPVRARWPATNFRWNSSLRPAQRLRRVQTSLRLIMGELCLPCACVPRGTQRAPAGRRHDRQSNDLSPGYWLFQRRRRKLSSDGRFPVSVQATRESSPRWTTLAHRAIG